MKNQMHSDPNRLDFKGKVHTLTFVGICLALFLVAAIFVLSLLEIENVVYANGKITSEQTYTIVSHMDGRITKLYIHAGDWVKEGTVIADIDSMGYEEKCLTIQAEIHELQKEEAVKKSELRLLEENPLPKELWYVDTAIREGNDRLERTQRRLARLEGLRAKHVVSETEFENAELDVIAVKAEIARAKKNQSLVNSGLAARTIEKARKDIELVQAKIDTKKAELDFAQRYLRDCHIVAPASGRILELPCKYTRYVEKGKPAAVLAYGDQLYAIAYVSEAQIRKIRPAQSVRISSAVFSRLEYGNFTGMVDRIYDTPIEDSTTDAAKYPVRIQLDPTNRPLNYGSSARFTIVTGKEPVFYTVFGFTKEK